MKCSPIMLIRISFSKSYVVILSTTFSMLSRIPHSIAHLYSLNSITAHFSTAFIIFLSLVVAQRRFFGCQFYFSFQVDRYSSSPLAVHSGLSRFFFYSLRTSNNNPWKLSCNAIYGFSSFYSL